MSGPLHGVRVVECASLWGAWAGKLLGELGADVVVIEPPGGHFTRTFGPFVDDDPHPERSLWWWYYNTSKRGVTADLGGREGADAFRRLVADADVVLEAETPGRLASLGLDHASFRDERPELIWASVTTHGRSSPLSRRPWTDLTMSAASGLAWMNGYDDHSRPPMRGRGNQTVQIGGVHAAMAVLTALLHRNVTRTGQHLDVSVSAACNVTTESGTFFYLVAGETVQRQTGRHAATQPTMEVQVAAADGRYVTTGFPPQEARDFRALLAWLDELGLRQTCPEVFFLEMGIERGGINVARDFGDPEVMAIFGAVRAALLHIAQNVAALAFFEGAQQRDIQVGMILSPDEAFENPHFVARGFQVTVPHDELGRQVRYPGPPFPMTASPCPAVRRAPLIGEHDSELLEGRG